MEIKDLRERNFMERCQNVSLSLTSQQIASSTKFFAKHGNVGSYKSAQFSSWCSLFGFDPNFHGYAICKISLTFKTCFFFSKFKFTTC